MSRRVTFIRDTPRRNSSRRESIVVIVDGKRAGKIRGVYRFGGMLYSYEDLMSVNLSHLQERIRERYERPRDIPLEAEPDSSNSSH